MSPASSDQCDLYVDLGDTAPVIDLEEPTETAVTPLAPLTAGAHRDEEAKEEDFFDGDTQVEVGPLTASA